MCLSSCQAPQIRIVMEFNLPTPCMSLQPAWKFVGRSACRTAAPPHLLPTGESSGAPQQPVLQTPVDAPRKSDSCCETLQARLVNLNLSARQAAPQQHPAFHACSRREACP